MPREPLNQTFPGPPVGPGTRVTLFFSLALTNGELIDSTGDTAATFEVGDGNLLPGFEQAMFGMRAGGKEQFAIRAEQGFGEPNEANIHVMKKQGFSKDLELVEGLVVSFSSGDGSELPGVITKVFDETVKVDFNHPLAGKELVFSVEIVQVEQISNEIVRV